MIVKVDVRTAATLLWRAGEGVVALPFPKSPTESHLRAIQLVPIHNQSRHH